MSKMDEKCDNNVWKQSNKNSSSSSTCSKPSWLLLSVAGTFFFPLFALSLFHSSFVLSQNLPLCILSMVLMVIICHKSIYLSLAGFAKDFKMFIEINVSCNGMR